MIEVLKLDGSKEFNVARDNLFCWTNGVVINRSLKGQGIQNNGLLTYQLSGSGNVALDGFGDFITYEVFPGEKAEVNPKCLIAWESTITPKQKNVIKKVIYHKYSKFQFKFIDEFKKDRLKAAKMVLKNFGVNFFTLNKNLLIFVWEELTINSFFRLKNWSFGQTEMYQVEGPGIIYLSSNI
ncbi:hypothetical protein HK099_006707 [Clydaea vesicula]|uniref:Altered inheritance of mitochondria protein 24, mitochondrial n=1 Tax=Clydaea vesicula TaxID=447962 RepID=A0AAD5U967_9FUNG|nr:hypothetical protein HK099_006707 [Clydaea vesicula]